MFFISSRVIYLIQYIISVGLPYLQTAMGYVVYDEERSSFNSEYPGYWIEVLEELAYRAGFSWRDSYGIILPFYHEHGYRPYANTTINDLLLWTVNAYDFSFAEWDRSIDRMKLGIDFPTGFRDSSTILIALTTDDDEANFHIFSFLQPFDWSVWLSIVITIIFTGLVYRLSSHIYKIEQSTTQERDRHETEHLPGVTIFYSALAATGHSEFKPSTYPESKELPNCTVTCILKWPSVAHVVSYVVYALFSQEYLSFPCVFGL